MKQNWEYKKLGEICCPKKEIARAGKIFSQSDLIKYIDIASIDNNAHALLALESIFFSDAPSRAQQKTEKNDILISLVRPNLKKIAVVDISDNNLVASSGFCVLRSNNLSVNKFIYYTCISDSFTKNMVSLTNGANYPAIREDDVRNYVIPVPPLSTQTAIVSELDALSAIIADHKSLLKKYDELEQSIFYYMFGDPVKNDKGWEVKKLGEVCEVVTKGTTPTTVGFKFEEEGINFIKVECFENGVLNMAKVAHVTEQCHESLKRSQLKENDILICIAGATVGKLAIVTKEILPANTNQACCIIRLSQSYVESRSYIFFILQSDYIKNYIKGLKKGVAQPNLTLDQVRNFLIPNVPLPLQQEFASKIEAIEAMKADTKKSLAKSEELFNARMDYYFNA